MDKQRDIRIFVEMDEWTGGGVHFRKDEQVPITNRIV